METNKLQSLLKEVKFQTTRSGGKGGQNVNKVATKVELYFDVVGSTVLNDDEKEKFFTKLKNKISDDGVLKIMAQSERTQFANKKVAIAKFEKAVEKAFTEPKKRLATTVTEEEKENRLREKKLTAEKKERRKKDFE
ncbi:MAG: alternative ribosome rescue aminoacyl-tRNA hydrolase ArfB [Bacteroidia bacterium]